MEVDGAKYVKAVTFLYEPKWFTSLFVMNEEHRKYWLGTLWISGRRSIWKS